MAYCSLSIAKSANNICYLWGCAVEERDDDSTRYKLQFSGMQRKLTET